MVDLDGDESMVAPTPPGPVCSTTSSQSLPSRLLSIVAAGELPTLPTGDATNDSNTALDEVLTPFLPLLSRLQSSRRLSCSAHSLPKATTLDATLLRVEEASKWRQYAHVFAHLAPSRLQTAISPNSEAAFRRFEGGSAEERVLIILCEWLLAAPGSLESSELLMNEIYQEDVAAILVYTLASSKLQTQHRTALNPLGINAMARKALKVPAGPVLLSRLAVNDPSSVEQLMDAVVAVVVETTRGKTTAEQEQDALRSSLPVLENARCACLQLAKLTPLYAARLREKLSVQTTSLHCAAMAFELLTTCTDRKDVSVFMYQWLKRDGAPGSALRTYVQHATRDTAATGEFSLDVVANLTKIRGILLDTLDATSNVSRYEVTAALGACVGLQVLGSFPLTEPERTRLLQNIDKLASASVSSRAISLGFIVVVLVWYPLAPALSKAPGQRDEHTKATVTLSQQVLVSLFQARDAGAGPLFVVSAVLFYTKAPALVPFLASVIGFDGENCNTASTSAAGCGIQVQQALRAEYLHVFGDVVLKPVLTENLLARQVLTFPPATRVSALDAVSSGHGQHEFTLRSLHGLLCEKSFLRHHHAHRLESWLATQVGEQAALPVHPLLVSLLLEWIENYVMAFEYPIAQAPRRLQLSIVPLRSSTLAKWLATPCLGRTYDPKKGQDHELVWARGVLGLTYALQFNQRLRHATMVPGSKLSSLVSTSSVASGASVSGALGPGADVCLHYDLSAFPLRNIATQALAHGEQGGAFEYVAPTLLKLMMEEYPQLFDAATASLSSRSTLQLLPLASCPRDVAERDLTSSWFRRRRKCGELPDIRVVQAPASWTAVKARLLELESAPIEMLTRELPELVDGFLPYAVVSSEKSPATCRQLAAFCSQFASLYETRARLENGADISLLMRLVHAMCFPDALWRQQQQQQTHPGATLQLLTYMQVLEEPFRLIDDAHEGVFRQPALLRVLLGLVRDVRAAANVHVIKCDPSLVSAEGMSASSSTTTSVQQHQLLQDCLLIHGLLKQLLPLNSRSRDNEVAKESQMLICSLVNELLVADAETSSSPSRLLLAVHTQGYDVSLVPTLAAKVPAMKLLWDHWMAATSSSASSRSATPVTKPLMEFVAEGAEKDLPKWRFRLRVVLSLCTSYLSGSRQSAAMQQALRVVWNKIRNGVGSSGESSARYSNLLGEVLPWIVDACSQNADLSAELVHFLLKLQRQQQNGSSGSKGRDARRAAAESSGKPQELEQVLRETYASFLQQI
ncbi:hypothetical protein V7S43_010494 [Phytophthora oleae]|uniref:Nucleolar pre-ribosomal-associated protein 1 C-terminal domain-containing protein n=1 Tax=Phytophthora oleae TaxID=2107226 RepID=A0ABD3FEA9_9STRA